MPYWNPLRLPDGRRPNREMPDNGDFTIPLVLWQYILMFVAERDLWHALDCREVCRTFRNLIDDYNTYAVIDMGMNRYLPEPNPVFPYDPHRGLFYQQCLDAGNPEAIFRHAMTILRDSGNVPQCMDYLRRASTGNGNEFSGRFRSILTAHPLSFYVLTMFEIIRGPEAVRSSAIQAMIRRMNDRNEPLYIEWLRQEAHECFILIGTISPEMMNHIPMRGWSFLPPPGRCEQCGEQRYLRFGLENMEWVDGDRALGKCCDTCLCYVEAAAFCKELRLAVPYLYTHLLQNVGV